MRIKKEVIVLLLLISAYFFGCSSGAQFEGYVEDFITSSPAKDVKVTAITKTDIKEEQKYARLNAKTDSNGLYNISKALKSKRYKLFVDENSYASTEVYSTSPEESVTKTIKNKIYIAKLPHNINSGFYLYPSMKRLPREELGTTRLRPDFIPRAPEGELIFSFISNQSKKPGSTFFKITSYSSTLNGKYNRDKNVKYKGHAKTFTKNGRYVTFMKVSLKPGIYAIHYEGYYNYYYFINIASKNLLELETIANDNLDSFWNFCNNGEFQKATELLSSTYVENLIKPLGGLERIYKHLKKNGFGETNNPKLFLLGQNNNNNLIGLYTTHPDSQIKRTIEFQLSEGKPKIDSLGIEGWPGLVTGKIKPLYENAFQSEQEIKSAKNWAYVNSKYAEYKVDNNSYIINAKTNNDYIWAYDASKSYKNYSFSADVSRPINDSGFYGLMFNYVHAGAKGQSWCRPSGYYFCINNTREFQIGYECGRSGGLHRVINGSSYVINPTGVNKIRIDHVGEVITIFVNGQKVYSAKGKDLYGRDFNYGNIGVYASKKGLNIFDNIQVISVKNQ